MLIRSGPRTFSPDFVVLARYSATWSRECAGGALWTPPRLRDVASGRVVADVLSAARLGAATVEVRSPALLIARSYMRVYDRCMVRKCASFAFGLALMVALGFAMALAHPLKAPGGHTGFSTPCEPASPAFKATSELKLVSTIERTFAAENAGAPAAVVRGSRVEAVPRAIPPLAPGAYPPSLHRPPPANS